ncbi:phosphoglucosamine mutase [Catellatospora citrea]|uniref:phosphoglucosamine mutase n=1 Tax=Catellatospora citrea TaxID=53366 RepID=UPI0033CA376F
MARLFGTDGVRGLANADLSPELALSLAVAAAHTLPDPDREQPPLVVVGRDPRASGEMLEAAVVAGLASAGANVVRVGVLPTPGVAYLTAEVRADFGVMISASHNPMPDNGIKFFAAGGHKLTDEQEDAIEAALGATWTRPTGAAVGRVHDLLDGAEHYTTHLVEATGHPLAGLKVVVDCAHGAASDVAPDAFRGAGAEVVAINAEPDGLNINDECGATHLGPLKAAVVEHGAHLGVAVDGDADRCLAVDASGTEVDGDQIMAILALAMRDAGTLVKDTLVATVMSNLGLRIAMREAGITLVETKVGDRYVLEELRAGGFSLGGEQSGHVVFTEHATTGDGVLTGLRLVARVAQTGKSLAELAAVVNRLPQVLINVRVADKAVARAPEILAAVAAAEAQLSGTGRVLLRPSGTEQLVRVMVEASGEDIAQKIAEDIAAEVRAASPAV